MQDFVHQQKDEGVWGAEGRADKLYLEPIKPSFFGLPSRISLGHLGLR